MGRQGAEKAKVKEEGTGGATFQAEHLVSSRKQGKVVDEANPGKPNRTRSGRRSKRRSRQGSRWFWDCLPTGFKIIAPATAGNDFRLVKHVRLVIVVLDY